MRIVVATDLYLPIYNGVAQFSQNLAIALAKQGHEVLVIAPSPTGNKYKEKEHGYTVARLSSLPLPFFAPHRVCLNPTSEVRKLIAEFKPDVAHIQIPLGIGLAVRSAAKKFKFAVVATNHTMPQNIIDNLKALAPVSRQATYIMREYGQWFHAKNIDYITMPTPSAIAVYQDLVNEIDVPVEAVSCGIDLSRFKPGTVKSSVMKKFSLPTSKPIVLYAGRLDGEKHISVLVDAAHSLHKTHDFHLVISGTGNDADNLNEQVQRLGMASYVTFLGRVSDADLPEVYKMGSVFVMPSPAELQSIVTMEAMATGLPVVVVDKGSVYELCQNGRNGYICRTDNVKDMVAKIGKILGDSQLAQAMSKESLAIAKEHDITYTSKRYVEIYRKAMVRRQARKPNRLIARLKTFV